MMIIGGAGAGKSKVVQKVIELVMFAQVGSCYSSLAAINVHGTSLHSTYKLPIVEGSNDEEEMQNRFDIDPLEPKVLKE
jgi:hypothetical protein